MANARVALSIQKLGVNLYNVRTERGITIQRLAEELGVSDRMISYYESGQRKPGLNTLILLSNALEVQIDDLLR